MVGVALGWQVYEQTYSSFALGMVGLAEILPILLLSLPAGHFADHADRKKIALFTKLALVILSALLGVLALQNGSILLLYAVIVGIGAASAYQNPANSSLIPMMVPQEVIGNAVAWSSNAWQLGSAMGPALGGLVIAISKSAVPVYFINVALGILYLILLFSTRSKQTNPIKSKEPVTLKSIAMGYHFLRETPILMATITLDLFAVLLGGAVALLPIFAKDILHVGPVGLGWMRAAPSFGATLMAVTLAHIPPFKTAGKTLLYAVAVFGIATIVFGVSKSFPLSLAMLFLLGAMDSISVVIRSTLLLLRTPDAMRGRVSAINSIFVGTSNEMGAFESGVVASWLGPIPAVVLGGVGTLFVVLATAFLSPDLRNLKTLAEPKEESVE